MPVRNGEQFVVQGLQPNRYVKVVNVSADGTMAANSDGLVATQKAIVTYVASQVAVENNWDRNSGSGYIYPATLTDRVGFGTNTPNSLVDITTNSLGTTQTDISGLVLSNNTASTVGTPVQISPASRWRGTGFETGGAVSQTFDFRADLSTVSQTTLIDGEWRLRSSANGASYVDRFGVLTSGNDTKLKVGGVNFFGKAGNQNDFYSGSTSLRFLSNSGGSIFATMDNALGTWILSPSSLTGSATTSAISIAQTWNTSGVATAIKLNITRTTSGSLSKLIDLQQGGTSSFAIVPPTSSGGTETLLQLNGNTVMAQGSGTTQYYSSSSGFAFYDQTGASSWCKVFNSVPGVWAFGINTLSVTPALPYRFMFIGNSEANSVLSQSNHTTPIPYFETRSSRGTPASPTATQSGDTIGGTLFGGRGATVWNTQAVAMIGKATQTYTDSANGSSWLLQTTPNGSVTRQNSIFVDQTNYVAFGHILPTSGIHLKTGANDAVGSAIVAENTSSGATAIAQIYPINNAGKYGGVAAYGSGYTGTLYGITKANLVEYTSNGDNVVYGAFSNKPAYIITNSVVRATFQAGGDMLYDGNIKLNTVGNGLYVKEGSNATMGTATLSGGTVVVSTTKVTANSRIFLTIDGGTLTNIGSVYVSARTAGTSFTISSTNVLDASDVAWIIIEPA